MNKIERINFRKMQAEDISEIKKLEIENGLAFWSERDYFDILDKDEYLSNIAVYEDKTIGFMIARLITQKVVDNSKSVNEFEIYNICVAKQFRREGIGQMLFKNCFAEFISEDESVFWLEVRVSNITAQKFYAGMGFKKSYLRKNFYRNPSEDALVMCLLETNKVQKLALGRFLE